MDERNSADRHWLVAGWPGMSNVAVIACGYLVKKLGLMPVAVIDGGGRFEVGAVNVRDGRVQIPEPPRTMLYSGKAGDGGPTVTVMIAEAQPDSNAMTFARDLIDRARQEGANHLLTFASMATQLEPTQEPRVFGATTDDRLADELVTASIEPLKEGEIGGMNGVMVGAAAVAGLPGVCLLGEIPYYAAQIANPSAASAVIGAFSRLTGIDIDRDELEKHADRVDRLLVRLREHMRTGSTEAPDLEGLEEEAEEVKEPAKPESGLGMAGRRRLEEMFDSVRRDQTKSVDLKKELDRLGVFKQYEDRFLDLFRRAG